MRRVKLVIALGLFAMCWTVASHAYTLAAYHWLVVPLVVYVNPTNRDVTAAAAEAAVKVGMSAWNGKSGFKYVYGGRVSDTATSIDGRNVVIFRNTSNGGAVATTYSWSSGGRRIDSDIVFWDGSYRFFTGTSGCYYSGQYGAYIEDIATHELGHELGLSHSSVTGATMYPVYKACTTTWRSLSSDDLAGLLKLYPGLLL